MFLFLVSWGTPGLVGFWLTLQSTSKPVPEFSVVPVLPGLPSSTDCLGITTSSPVVVTFFIVIS